MAWQDFAIFLLSVISGGAGWFLRELWGAVAALKKDLHLLENDVRTNFARRDDVRDAFKDLMDAVIRIEAKLDGKADK
jgi:hypothetical protein